MKLKPIQFISLIATLLVSLVTKADGRRDADKEYFEETKSGYIYRSEIDPDKAIYATMEIPSAGFRILKMPERCDVNSSFEMVPKNEKKDNWTQFIAGASYSVPDGVGTAFDQPEKIVKVIKENLNADCKEVLKEEIQDKTDYKIVNMDFTCKKNHRPMFAVVRTYIGRENITEVRYLFMPEDNAEPKEGLQKMHELMDGFVEITSGKDKAQCIIR